MAYTKQLAVLILLLALGCSTTEKPDIAAERSIRAAVAVVDGFLMFEYQNRDSLSIDVTHAADMIRGYVPGVVRLARSILRDYREGKATLEDLNAALALVAEAQGMAERYHTDALRETQ